MRRKRTHTGRLPLFATTLAAFLLLSLAPLSRGADPAPAYLATPLSSPPLQAHLSVFAPSAAEAAPVSTNSSNSVYFRQTGHYLKDAFLNYWLMNGGVPIYGYPISEELTLNGVIVQYFERSRFEYHANSSRPWKVELSSVGSILTEGSNFPPGAPGPQGEDRAFYQVTGHNISGVFYQFWRASGGLGTFGYPISEELRDNGRTRQYFERARFELTGQGRVQLGHLGAELLERDKAAGRVGTAANARNRPGFNMSFRGEATTFHANWDRVISLNKQWGNLPQDYVGRGLYAAAPADLNLYGRWARVTRGNRSIFVQFIDVINWPDIPYVRSRGIVIDLGDEAYHALGVSNGGRYEASFDVLWPGDEP